MAPPRIPRMSLFSSFAKARQIPASSLLQRCTTSPRRPHIQNLKTSSLAFQSTISEARILRSSESHQRRTMTTSTTHFSDVPSDTTPQQKDKTPRPARPASSPAASSLSSLSQALVGGSASGSNARSGKPLEEYTTAYQGRGEHHLYVYAHKHNTHVTLTGPQFPDPRVPGRMRQNIILSLSCGSIGYRKSQRNSFEAAYQLGSYFMSRVQNDGLLMKIHALELVLRGFGNGREALTKLMLGQEGAALRDRVVRVVDASKVKMGGQRAPRPRRLG